MTMYRVVFLVAALNLFGCGEGGSDSGSSGPVASTYSFNILQAFVNDFNTSSSKDFQISGTISGQQISGSGKLTLGSVSSASFENHPALQRTTSVTGSITKNGIVIPNNYSFTRYTDTNYNPLGTNGSEYEVVNGIATVPTSVHINDTGNIYTANRYTNSSKFYPLGTVQVTYLVEADTATTALVKLILTYKNTSSVTTKISTAQYRITNTNLFTLLNETALTYTNGQISENIFVQY